jgi:hypothetical protein
MHSALMPSTGKSGRLQKVSIRAGRSTPLHLRGMIQFLVVPHVEALTIRLSKLTSNREAFRAYRCDTFWKHTDTPNVSSKYISTQSSKRPTKRRHTFSPVSTTHKTPPPINRPCLPPPAPVKKKPKSKSPSDLELRQVCDNLKVCLQLSNEDLSERESICWQRAAGRRTIKNLRTKLYFRISLCLS